MNHSFIAASWNPKVCNKCTKSEDVHGNEVTCESCSNVGPVEIVGKLLLCAECQQRELNTQVAVVISPDEQLSLEQIRNQVDRLVDGNSVKSINGDSVKTMVDEAIRGNIKSYTDFFNAKIPSIIELEQRINSSPDIAESDKKYALAHALRARIQYLARVLFQLKNGQLETCAEIKVIQEHMSKTIPELRMKLRHEFALNTPNYTPQVIKATKPKASGPKGQSNKLAESYAKAMKIPYEQALKLIENKLRDDCTCSVTPGICKVHK
jgi:hypothetical protein